MPCGGHGREVEVGRRDRLAPRVWLQERPEVGVASLIGARQLVGGDEVGLRFGAGEA